MNNYDLDVSINQLDILSISSTDIEIVTGYQ